MCNNLVHPSLLKSGLISLGFICIFALIGCGGSGSKYPPHLYYETTLLKQSSPKKNEKKRLILSLEQTLGKRKVYRKTLQSTKQVFPSVSGLKSLSHEELRALWTAHPPRFYGAELDLKVKLPKRKAIPITVWIDLKGNLTVQKGRWAPLSKPPPKKQFSQHWKIGPLKAESGKKWSKKALKALHLALSLVNSKERSVLRKIPFVRKQRGPRKQQAALYVYRDCYEEIQIFNRAMTAERYTFVGSSQKAYPSTTFSILHEIGHALHNKPTRQLQCQLIREYQAYKKSVKRANQTRNPKKRAQRIHKVKQTESRLNEMQRQVKRFQKQGPVLKAYKAVIGNQAPPTLYGETSLRESFAESFALYHLDPQALKRLLPKVYFWFKEQKHLLD